MGFGQRKQNIDDVSYDARKYDDGSKRIGMYTLAGAGLGAAAIIAGYGINEMFSTDGYNLISHIDTLKENIGIVGGAAMGGGLLGTTRALLTTNLNNEQISKSQLLEDRILEVAGRK